MNPDKQLEKLNKLVELLDTDHASTDEVAMAFEAVLGVIKQLKDQIDQEMRQNKGEMDDLFTGVVAELKKLENRITRTSDQLEAKMGVDNESIRKQLLSEVNALRDLIPQLPDLTYLENRIDAVESLIPKIPDELSAEQVRDKLETLKKENRLDSSSIKGLEALVKETKTVISGGLTRAKTDSLYTKFHEGGSNLTVSATAPSNPITGDLWVDTS